MKRTFLILSLLVVAISCVTEYQPETIRIAPALVVEGQITDQPGPYTVRLTRTGDFSNKGINLLETGAIVSIEDNVGNREALREQSPGVYQTRANGMQGVAGRRYKLTVQTRNGQRFESDAETLTAAPPILNVYTEYNNQLRPGTQVREETWDVYLDTKDPETAGNFYRWEWTHYEAINICQKTEQSDGSFNGLFCCSPCWDIVRCYNCINVSSDANFNGRNLSRQRITTVPYTSRSRYYLEIQQQAISRGAYQFWKSVRGLVNNTGGLFDPAPASVQGNIRNLTSAAEPVYGYFGATGISERGFYVDRGNGQGIPQVSPPVVVSPLAPCFPCENSIYRTPNKPRFWVY
ncbi:DUF4249 domain-containing protein [Spirosoma montaniterrae]|uniref:DUF4249 domain-containing protein n=1 Tax=Spirosoma montaniterrae TaxID=1178516 RepID=A0A1P9WVQ3_9BACT|nr:DUF4249 domain-containing protein [Spirosoma montaniterrae]AQG79464.1 hypothetical protein AWR27_09115 [Spirosoma montaniterrae]